MTLFSQTSIATTVFILILFLPAACLPLALDTFFSSTDLSEMGVCLETSDDTFPMQGYELICIPQDSDKREDTNEYVWRSAKDFRSVSNLSA